MESLLGIILCLRGKQVQKFPHLETKSLTDFIRERCPKSVCSPQRCSCNPLFPSGHGSSSLYHFFLLTSQGLLNSNKFTAPVMQSVSAVGKIGVEKC